MDITKASQLIGFSHKNKEANKSLREMGFTSIPGPNELYDGVPFYVNYTHDNLDITLKFNGYTYFTGEFGEPTGYSEKNPNELILMWVTLNENYLKNIGNKNELPFPFDLKDEKDEIIKTLKKTRLKVKKYPGGDSIYYIQHEKTFNLSFNELGLTKSIIITPIRKQETKIESIESKLHLQKKNILKSNAILVEEFPNPIPNLDWNYQSEFGGEKAKDLVTTIFLDLQKTLVLSTRNGNAKGIYFGVKDAIEKLNMAQESGLQIDTDERELLCLKIDSLVAVTGFDQQDSDITQQWRNW